VPKGPPPRWAQRDCRFDHLVRAAVGQGYGVVVVYRGITSLDRAHDIRRGVYRCARHRGISADAGPAGQLAAGEEMGVRKAGRGYELWFRVWPKNDARRRHIRRYGTDRQRWPYNPRRRASDAERASWAPRDETGKPAR
jgi:hypothetical protein